MCLLEGGVKKKGFACFRGNVRMDSIEDSAKSFHQRKTLPSAVASLILGILSCIILGIFSAIPAVILGHKALSILKQAPAKYRGKRLAITGLISGYLGICLSLIIAVLILNAFRTYSVNDNDLIYNPQKIEDSKNAYVMLLPVLKQIKEQLHKDKPAFNDIDLAAQKRSADHKETDQLLRRYSSYLSKFSDAMMLNMFQVPIINDIESSADTHFIVSLGLLEKLSVIKIESLLARKKYEEAQEDILKLFKYGYLLQNSDAGNSSYFYLLGLSAKKRAFALIQRLVKESNMKSSYYRNLADQLQLFADNSSGLLKSLKRQYTVMRTTMHGFLEKANEETPEYKKILTEYSKHPWKIRFLFNKSATIKELAEFYRQEIKNIYGPYSEITHKKIYRPIYRPSWVNLVAGNVIGKMLLALVPSWDNIINHKFELDAQYNLIKILLALKENRADNHKLPDRLEDLVPNYLNDIPRDPFAGKSIRYSKTGKKIYSVFSDGKDDGGDEEKDLVLKFNDQVN